MTESAPLARRAVDMPELCSELQGHIQRAPAGYLAMLRKTEEQGGWSSDDELTVVASGTVAALRQSELYFVTEPMSDLVRAAAQSLTDMPIAPHDFPSPVGLMYFSDGWREQARGPSALMWAFVGARLGIVIFETPDVVTDGTVAVLGMRPHLVPSFKFLVPLSDTFRLSYQRDKTDEVLSVLLTACYLLRQKLAVVTRAATTRAEQRKLRRGGTDLMAVRVIAMRSLDGAPSDESAEGREWRHRWIVRGHWRKQWYATDQVNRPIWIAPHIKGPEGAPMLGTEKVYALQR